MIISGNLFSQRIELFKQKGSEVTIIDTVEKYKIVIDSSHLFVSVFNRQNYLLWKKYVSHSSYCKSCKAPQEIDTIELKIVSTSEKITSKNSEIGIFVSHTNCYSYFDLKSGENHLLGCD